MLAQAEALLAEEFGQPDAAAVCYEILALFPDHKAASDLILQAFSDPKLIRDNRQAIGRHIDEWDDRKWQERRRLALSYRFMSRREGQYREYNDQNGLTDVKEMLEEGHDQLLQDYLLGQTQGSEAAWLIFQAAIRRSNNPQAAMLWVGELYADQGYFAESVEVLEDLLSRFDRAHEARRLWAEMRWWRDHQHEVPWVPPTTGENGRRFRRIMSRTDADFAADPEAYMTPLDYVPPDSQHLPPDFALPAMLSPELRGKLEALLGESPPLPRGKTAVNWEYLQAIEEDAIDTSRFPEWAQYMLLEIDSPEQEAYLRQLLLSYLANSSYGEEE
jgi:hypothetical protein